MSRRKHKRYKFKYQNIFLFAVILVLIFVLLNVLKNRQDLNVLPLPQIDDKINKEEQRKKEEDYQNCLNEPVSNEEMEALTENINEINNFIVNNKYEASVYFEDLTTGLNYTYQKDKIYYGCSLIKIVDALYLINKAIAGEINLDTETLTYTKNYRADYSDGMATRKIGEQVSLRDLITYAISVSDNTAHLMLIDYIGFANLKAYGQSLGAKVILTGGDNFGNQTAEDTNIYLKEAYRIIKENEEYGSFLKTIMDNDERNAFNTDTVRIYHKYGSYGVNYHDIGLNLGDHPYTISILTLHEGRNYTEVVQNIHEQVRNLQNSFYENRESLCQNRVYSS